MNHSLPVTGTILVVEFKVIFAHPYSYEHAKEESYALLKTVKKKLFRIGSPDISVSLTRVKTIDPVPTLVVIQLLM